VTSPSPDLLRSLIREVVEEVLRDVLSQGLGTATAGSAAPPATGSRSALHPPQRDDRPQAVRRIERGAVTEAVVRQAARDGVGLVLGRRAVLTPLGRDLSRTLGVDVERRTDTEER
jgi:hypothetical protein